MIININICGPLLIATHTTQPIPRCHDRWEASCCLRL